MKPSFRLVSAAADDLAGAVQWYEVHRRGLGAELLQEFARALARIAENPRLGISIRGRRRRGLRRITVDRFPYRVVYDVRPSEIVIMAVAHPSRKPNFWSRR